MQKSPRLVAAAAALTLSFGALTAPAASAADEATTEPCAKQSAQVQKAEDALARVTAVFEKKQTKVKKQKNQVAKVKKAQVQRLDKANQRLEKCQAAPDAPETPEAPETPAA